MTIIGNSATGVDGPNFVKEPDAVNTDSWESLVPLFYWDTRDLNVTGVWPPRCRVRPDL